MKGKIILYIPNKNNGYLEYGRFQVEAYRASFKNIKNDRHKSWKHFMTVSRPCGQYESGTVSVYKTSRKGVYALTSYYDGSFWPLVAYSKLSDEAVEALENARNNLFKRKKAS